MSHVFISHAQSTNELTRRVADRLRAGGYDVWWDDELPVHRPFSPIIAERLRSAKAVLVIWSRDALESDWVHAEAEAGRSERKLVQISADGTSPPLPFNQTQYANLTGWHGDAEAPAWRKVVASVTELLEVDRATIAPVAPTGSMARRSGRKIVVASAVAAVALASSVIWWGATRPRESSTIDRPASPAAHVGPRSDPLFGDRPAIAVLPFENRSDDPQHAIFADGLAEDLITRLSAWRSFPVIARTSSFQYRGDVDVKRVANELNVRYVALGSVRREGDRLRVNVQLVDAQSSATLWSRTYERPVGDVFELQDEVSSAIAAPMVEDLARAEANRAEQRNPQNLEAWSLYQLANQRLARVTRADVAAARELFQRAVALEPRFAAAFAGIAYTHMWEQILAPTDAKQQNLASALAAARHAVELDPLSADAYAALGWVQIFSRSLPEALDTLSRAVELNPSLAVAWSNFGYAKWVSGDPAGCIEANERALRLDPDGPYVPYVHENLSDGYWDLGQFDTGLKHARILVAARPDYAWGYLSAAFNEVGLGRIDEARAAIGEARRVQPDLSIAYVTKTTGVSDPAVAARRVAALRTAGLQ